MVEGLVMIILHYLSPGYYGVKKRTQIAVTEGILEAVVADNAAAEKRDTLAMADWTPAGFAAEPLSQW